MQQSFSLGWDGFGRRVLGALRLKSDVYREISAAPTGITQAIAVILLGSLVSAIVYLVRGESAGLSIDVDWARYPVTRESDALAALAGAVLDAGWGLLIWAAQAAIVLWIWNRFSNRTRSWRAVAAPLGFASAPLIVFGLLELVPAVGGMLAAVGLLWTVIAAVVALRAVLETGWGRPVILLVVSTVVLLPFSFLISRIS